MNLKLTDYEKSVLNGDQGEAKQIAMDIIVKTATSLDAEELVEVVSVQAMAHFGSLHIAGRDWMEKLAGMEGKCCVLTTQDPASIPFDKWAEMGYDEQYAENQIRLKNAVIKLGEVPIWSCTPYTQGNVPRFNQNVAWAESSAVSYANSVLGARTNRTPAGIAICSALTGRAPREGYYLDENRVPEIKLIVDAGALNDLDYSTIGILTGKLSGNNVPAIFGLPPNVTNDNLKHLGASAASSGSVAIYHAIDITPETFVNRTFKTKKYQEEIIIDREMLDNCTESMSTNGNLEPGLAVLGCPHASISEILTISDLMKGKTLKKDKAFWIFTTSETEAILRRMGIIQNLEKAGITIMAQTCLVISPLVGNYKSLITNSGKFASYLPSEHGVDIIYANTPDCIDAVAMEE